MRKYYTIERNAQIVLYLLKAKGIKKVIASPGTTNISIVGSMQNDSFFEMYSAPDERSAAYIACGLAAESGEPVVLTCTGATASRNYLPGLTEAYYRKLPIIALTSSLNIFRSGHLYPQFIDRTEQPKDVVRYSVQIPIITSQELEWECEVKVNNALLELNRRGGGPVHINLMTAGEFVDFSVKELPVVREIRRVTINDILPKFSKGRIAIFIGSHTLFSDELTEMIDSFCASNNSVVFCDHTSGYKGKFKILYPIAAAQGIVDINLAPDILIHIGEISGDYYVTKKLKGVREVWRVSEDGEIRDYFHKISYVFEMSELSFFKAYVGTKSNETPYYDSCCKKLVEIRSCIKDFPFSNIWIASKLADKIPDHSVLHLGILNSLRAWNFFEIPSSVNCYCNVGGFGIDGCMSALIGASLSSPNKIFYGVFGDLAFFYDINVLGNRHIGNNLRILLINNGKGTEFRNYTHPGSKFGDEADKFIAAGGHYGDQSQDLIKHYSTDLGFDYFSASNKAEFELKYNDFLNPSKGGKSLIFEVFTNNEDESKALGIISNIIEQMSIKRSIINSIKNTIGENIYNLAKSFLGK